MIGILYVFHGSQKEEKNQAAMSFIQQVKKQVGNEVRQEVAFLENHPATIEVIATRLIKAGVTQLIVMPVLLFSAKHALVDIPEVLAQVKISYPEIKITQTDTFGSRNGSRQVLLERFKEESQKHSDKLIGFLLAHGTKQTEQPQEILQEIAQEIETEVRFPIYAVSLKGTENYIDEIRKKLSFGSTPVIVPFFLYHGHLIDLMKKKLIEEFPEQTFVVTPPLNFDPRLEQDIVEIVREEMQCIQ